MNLVQIQHEIHQKLLSMQRLYRLITSDRFELAYESSSEEDRNLIEQYIKDNSQIMIMGWINRILRNDYETYNMIELRQLAKHLNIPNYQTSTRDLLLSQIYQRKQRHDTR